MAMATLETPLPGNFRLVARYRDEKGGHENEVSAEANAGSIGVKRSGRS